MFAGLSDGAILSSIALGVGVAIVFLVGYSMGRHGRQHWETDMIVEKKLLASEA